MLTPKGGSSANCSRPNCSIRVIRTVPSHANYILFLSAPLGPRNTGRWRGDILILGPASVPQGRPLSPGTTSRSEITEAHVRWSPIKSWLSAIARMGKLCFDLAEVCTRLANVFTSVVLSSQRNPEFASLCRIFQLVPLVEQ